MLNEGWIRFNYDGLMQGNLGPSGVGCVDNFNGCIIPIQHKRLELGTYNKFEVQVPLLEVEMVHRLQVNNMYLEGNSQINMDIIGLIKTHA